MNNKFEFYYSVVDNVNVNVNVYLFVATKKYTEKVYTIVIQYVYRIYIKVKIKFK